MPLEKGEQHIDKNLWALLKTAWDQTEVQVEDLGGQAMNRVPKTRDATSYSTVVQEFRLLTYSTNRLCFILLNCNSTKTCISAGPREIFSPLWALFCISTIQSDAKRFFVCTLRQTLLEPKTKQDLKTLLDWSRLYAYSASSRKGVSCRPYHVQLVLIHKEF